MYRPQVTGCKTLLSGIYIGEKTFLVVTVASDAIWKDGRISIEISLLGKIARSKSRVWTNPYWDERSSLRFPGMGATKEKKVFITSKSDGDASPRKHSRLHRGWQQGHRDLDSALVPTLWNSFRRRWRLVYTSDF